MSVPTRSLSPIDVNLIDIANAVINSNSTSNIHFVASAALAHDGQIFTGVNVRHFTGSACAELVVIGTAAARAGPSVELVRIVAVANRKVINPCGRCRQVLRDLHPTIRVIVQENEKPVTVSIDDLLPYPYNRMD